jgi:hypothetical protein
MRDIQRTKDGNEAEKTPHVELQRALPDYGRHPKKTYQYHPEWPRQVETGTCDHLYGARAEKAREREENALRAQAKIALLNFEYGLPENADAKARERACLYFETKGKHEMLPRLKKLFNLGQNDGLDEIHKKQQEWLQHYLVKHPRLGT